MAQCVTAKAHSCSAPNAYKDAAPTFDQMAERVFELEDKLKGLLIIILVINIKRRLNDIRVVFIKEIKNDGSY
jgi:hypothetical protein